MVEKDVEYGIKNLILSSNENSMIKITNEFNTDGIVRYNGVAKAILEFKVKRNFQNEATTAQVLCQAMCYYYKLLQKESVDTNKPFFLIIGDDNEIIVINLHKLPNNWMMNPKWGSIAPSRSGKEKDLLEVATSMLSLISPLYYKYDDIKELSFGFKLIFGNDFT